MHGMMAEAGVGEGKGDVKSVRLQNIIAIQCGTVTLFCTHRRCIRDGMRPDEQSEVKKEVPGRGRQWPVCDVCIMATLS